MNAKPNAATTAASSLGPVELTGDEEAELRRLIRVYRREADRCAAAGAFLAACVMHGSVLETMLILTINAFSEEALATSAVPKKRGGAPKPVLSWTITELLAVAKEAKWLPAGLKLDDDWSFRKARLGDYAEVVRMVRNLVHPRRYLEDHRGRRVAKKHWGLANDVVSASFDAMLQKLYASLEMHLEADRAATSDVRTCSTNRSGTEPTKRPKRRSSPGRASGGASS
jgi:hypothetical protein